MSRPEVSDEGIPFVEAEAEAADDVNGLKCDVKCLFLGIPMKLAAMLVRRTS